VDLKNSTAFLHAFSGRALDFGLVALATGLLLFAAIAKRGNVTEISASSALLIAAATPPPLAYLKNMKALRGDTAYSLDAVQQPQSAAMIVARRPKSLTIRGGTQTTLIGWAVDSPSRRSADSVYVLLDGKLVTSCQVANARADVAAALRNPSFVMSGFACGIGPTDIVVGRHSIQLDIVAQGGRRYYVAKPPTALVAR
jgi:hypothetical protein